MSRPGRSLWEAVVPELLAQRGFQNLSSGGMRDAVVTVTTAGQAADDLAQVIDEQTAFGDVGRALPQVYVLHGAKISDLSGLASAAQVVALGVEALSGLAPDVPVCILTTKNRA